MTHYTSLPRSCFMAKATRWSILFVQSCFLEVLIVFVEYLAREIPDCGVFAIRKIGERNACRGVDNVEPVTGQQYHAGFLREAE